MIPAQDVNVGTGRPCGSRGPRVSISRRASSSLSFFPENRRERHERHGAVAIERERVAVRMRSPRCPGPGTSAPGRTGTSLRQLVESRLQRAFECFDRSPHAIRIELHQGVGPRQPGLAAAWNRRRARARRTPSARARSALMACPRVSPAPVREERVRVAEPRQRLRAGRVLAASAASYSVIAAGERLGRAFLEQSARHEPAGMMRSTPEAGGRTPALARVLSGSPRRPPRAPRAARSRIPRERPGSTGRPSQPPRGGRVELGDQRRRGRGPVRRGLRQRRDE